MHGNYYKEKIYKCYEYIIIKKREIMAINEWKIFKKHSKGKGKKINIDENISVIEDFLKHINIDAKETLEKLEQYKKLRKGKQYKKDIEKQLEAWHEFLKHYWFLEDDVDTNGERVKKITARHREVANKLKISRKLREKINKDTLWVFDW